jgi:DNA gyrase/topoisomerase IV subunit A
MSLLDRIITIAREESADTLLEMSAATLHADLYEEAVEEYGGWDGALAAALSKAVEDAEQSNQSQVTKSPRRKTTTAAEEQVERVVTAEAEHPLFTLSSGGSLFKMRGGDFGVTEVPMIPPTPHGAGRINSLVHLGEPSGVLVFSDRGHYFGLDMRMVPNWDGDLLDRRIQDVIKLEEGEKIVDVLRRDQFHGGRIIHVTCQAKAKASDISDITYTLDRQPRDAFLLNEGDRPVAVLAGPEKNSVFCASAMGKGIHFDAEDLRTMGLQAAGVNAIKLDGERDAVVGAFLGAGVDQIALITERGMGKRVDFDEFRKQNRAGAGLQLLRLDRGDHVAAVVACEADGDLAVTTDRGRVHRMPATSFHKMGRPAKGDLQIDLVDDERVVGLSALPCGKA